MLLCKNLIRPHRDKRVSCSLSLNIQHKLNTLKVQIIRADSLSRVESIRLPVEIDLNDLAAKQETDEQLKAIRESPDYPLSFKRMGSCTYYYILRNHR